MTSLIFQPDALDPDLHAGVDEDFDAVEPPPPEALRAQSLIAAGLLEPIP